MILQADKQADLVYELKQLYALVNVCRLALEDQGQDETDSCSEVLMQAVNRLYELHEQQAAIAKQLQAEPEEAPDPAESLAACRDTIDQAAANTKARMTATAAATLKSQFDSLWSNYTKGVGESGIDPAGLLEPDLLALSGTINQLHELHHGKNGGANND